MLKELFKEYITLNLGDYFKGVDFPITMFVLSIAIGICIACVFITIHKRNLMFMIKALTRHEAYNEDSAKTLSELRLKPSLFLKGSLSRRSQLTSIVGMVGGYPFETSGKQRVKPDLENARFFIKPSENGRAMKLSETTEPNYINTALGCILILMIFITLTLFLPRILELITGLTY